MTAKKQLVAYLKQLPELALVDQLLQTMGTLFKHLALAEDAPALCCLLQKDGRGLLVQLNGIVVLEHQITAEEQYLGLAVLESDLEALPWVLAFQPQKNTSPVLGLAQLPLKEAVLTHADWRQAWFRAAQTALEAPAQDRPKQHPHHAWMYQAAVDDFVQQDLLKAVSQDDHYAAIIQKAVDALLQQPDIQALQQSGVFWLEKGRLALQAFEQSQLPEPADYDAFLGAYQHHQGRYDDFVAHLDRPAWREFAWCLGQLVAYCHARAANKQIWNAYEDKRTVDDTGVLQHLWVPQLVAYHRAGHALEAIKTVVARQALRYLKTPAAYLPLLSRKYRRQIMHHLLNTPYQADQFDAQILAYFARFKALKVKHPHNYTYLLKRLLLTPALKALWQYTEEDVYYNELQQQLEEPRMAYFPLAPAGFPLNQILYGPPGCGKTYFSIRRALALIENRPLKHIKALDEHRLKELLDDYQTNGQLVFTTFHQAMSYEDFIEGIKPVTSSKGVQYEVQDGILKQLVQRALEAPHQVFVLAIDELNRGNVVQIFGELFTLLEADKRLDAPNALRVTLPYSKTDFGLPSNLYFIATMNSTDRSAEQLDLALRRRFSFVAMRPDPRLLSEDVEGINLQLLLQSINERIALLLDAQYSIGHAYFMGISSLKELQRVFETELIPLLVAYFYGDLGKLGLVLGKAFLTSSNLHYDQFADFDYEGLDRFSDKPLYQIATFPLPKSAYLHIYN